MSVGARSKTTLIVSSQNAVTGKLIGPIGPVRISSTPAAVVSRVTSLGSTVGSAPDAAAPNAISASPVAATPAALAR